MRYIKSFYNHINESNKDSQQIFLERKLDVDFLNNIDIERDSTILDISYGNGVESKFLSSKGHTVYSTEQTGRNKEMLGNATHVTHDTRKRFPFPPNSFDVVFSRLGLHYFTEEELESIFEDLNRIIKDGGKLSFMVKILDDEIKTGKIFHSPSRWEEFCTDHGFEVISSETKSGLLYEVESNWLELHSIKIS